MLLFSLKVDLLLWRTLDMWINWSTSAHEENVMYISVLSIHPVTLEHMTKMGGRKFHQRYIDRLIEKGYFTAKRSIYNQSNQSNIFSES